MRRSRLTRVGGALLLAAMLLTAPTVARADNCGGLSDCFFTIGTAVVAALLITGLIVLAVEFLPALLAAEEVGLAAGTGAFLEGVEGGAGLGSLAGVELEASAEGLATVTEHLAQFGEYGPNAAMLERLQEALSAGRAISGADLSFYLHELTEAELMGQGLTYEAAHAQALAQYGVSPFSVYAPEVIQAFPELFNANWFRFWGLIP